MVGLLSAQEGKVDVVRLLTEAQAQVNIQIEVHLLCHDWSTSSQNIIYMECCGHVLLVDVYISIITRRMFNIIGERERSNPSCQPSYCTIEVKKGTPWSKSHAYHGVRRLDKS